MQNKFKVITDMKKRITKLLFIGVFIIGCLYSFSEERQTVETLIFDNIEALAYGEDGGATYHCYGAGNIDCYGYKVEYMIDGMDLD